MYLHYCLYNVLVYILKKVSKETVAKAYGPHLHKVANTLTLPASIC